MWLPMHYVLVVLCSLHYLHITHIIVMICTCLHFIHNMTRNDNSRFLSNKKINIFFNVGIVFRLDE